MLFGKRFTVAWAADGYVDYLNPGSVTAESGSDVLQRLLHRGSATPVARRPRRLSGGREQDGARTHALRALDI